MADVKYTPYGEFPALDIGKNTPILLGARNLGKILH
jgi:hypothetical protein